MRKDVIGVVCIGIAIIVVIATLYITGNLYGKSSTDLSPPPSRFQGSLATNWNEYVGPEDLPAGDNFVAISSFTGHSLALRSNGTIVCLGSNMYGQCDVPDESDFIAVSAGSEHSLALRSNGTIACWGSSRFNECDVPNEKNFVAIAAGSENSLALRSNGTIVCWGGNRSGECTIPPDDDFIAISAGWLRSLALQSDGTIACLGSNLCEIPPADSYVAISASSGFYSNLALTSNGKLVASDPYTGWNYYVPPGNDYVAISAGHGNNLALRSDGTIVCWGYEFYRCNFSSSTNAIAISAGYPNLAITNPRAKEILAAEWQKTKACINPKAGDADRMQPLLSRTPVYPAEYVIKATLPEIPDKIMVYTIEDYQSLDEKKHRNYYRFTIPELENDPYHYKPYKGFPIKTPEEAVEEFKTHRFELVDSWEYYQGPVEKAEKIVVSNISFVYMRRPTVSGIICLQPSYSFEGYVQKGNKTAAFVTDWVPATENLVEFDFMNKIPTLEMTRTGTSIRSG